MGFGLSAKAKAQTAQKESSGGYLSLKNIKDGEPARFHVVSQDPLEFWQVWGESPDGQAKPFRFTDEPSPSDIDAELGEYTRRLNFEGTAPDKVVFSLAFFAYNYDTETIQVVQFTQKTLIRELDSIVSMEDYEDLSQWDFSLGRDGKASPITYSLRCVPIKKGTREKIDAAWAAAQEKGYDLNQLLTGGNPFGAAK